MLASFGSLFSNWPGAKYLALSPSLSLSLHYILRPACSYSFLKAVWSHDLSEAALTEFSKNRKPALFSPFLSLFYDKCVWLFLDQIQMVISECFILFLSLRFSPLTIKYLTVVETHTHTRPSLHPRFFLSSSLAEVSRRNIRQIKPLIQYASEYI